VQRRPRYWLRCGRPTQQAACVRCRTEVLRRCAHSSSAQIAANHVNGDRIAMLETIAVILLILWALGLVTSYTLGGFIHILLVLAVIVILVRLIQGRRI
jgi:hypothetical protein